MTGSTVLEDFPLSARALEKFSTKRTAFVEVEMQEADVEPPLNSEESENDAFSSQVAQDLDHTSSCVVTRKEQEIAHERGSPRILPLLHNQRPYWISAGLMEELGIGVRHNKSLSTFDLEFLQL